MMILCRARRLAALVVLLVALAMVTGCDSTPQQQIAPATDATKLHQLTKIQMLKIDESAAHASLQAPILPAYETEAERIAGAKNDAADDYRNSNRKWFAQTVPPTAEAYRPFGEWEKMQAVWTTYSNGMPSVKPVRRMMAQQTINFVRHSNPKVTAFVIVSGDTQAKDFNAALTEFGITDDEKKLVKFAQMPNQTIWHIDYGPFPLIHRKDNTVAFADYMYYPNRQIDDAIPSRIGESVYKEITTFKMPFPFEGGNIQADGDGLCMTSNRALQNTGYSALKARNLLKKYNGCHETVIVKDISDDGTGHIDMFFKWVSADHVMFGRYENEITLDYDGDGKEETLPIPGKINSYKKTFELNQKRMDDNAALMASITSPVTGKKIKVSRLSMMTALRDQYGYLPRTFINSTFTNGVNVYPSYADNSCRDPAGATCMKDAECGAEAYCSAGKCTKFGKNSSDQVVTGSPKGCDELDGCPTGLECAPDPMKIGLKAQVQKQWEVAMPDYKHVGLVADRIALWSGAIHCITRTIPDNPIKKAIHDGLCLGGKCGCVDGGFDGECKSDADCHGAKLICNCNLCRGQCTGSGKNCTDDADCSTDSKTVVEGSCQIDPNQTCKGESASGGSCGSLAWEGWCDGKTLKYCSSGEAKQIKCPACCGWDAGEGSYNCLSKTTCGASCVDECDEEGKLGCSLENSHSWKCVKKDGCLKREWLYCDAGKACGASGECAAVGGGGEAPKCPPGWGTSGGGTSSGGDVDAGGAEEDAGASSGGASSGGTDGGQAGLDGETGSSSGTTTAPPPADDGGCSATPARTSNGGFVWLMMLLGALSFVWTRRKAV